MLPVVLVQPLGSLGLVLHSHDDHDAHTHIVAAEALLTASAGEAPWHEDHHGRHESAGDVPGAGGFGLAGTHESVILLADLIASSARPGRAAVPAAGSIGSAPATALPAAAPLLAPLQVRPWQLGARGGPSGIPGLLLRSHALLL